MRAFDVSPGCPADSGIAGEQHRLALIARAAVEPVDRDALGRGLEQQAVVIGLPLPRLGAQFDPGSIAATTTICSIVVRPSSVTVSPAREGSISAKEAAEAAEAAGDAGDAGACVAWQGMANSSTAQAVGHDHRRWNMNFSPRFLHALTGSMPVGEGAVGHGRVYLIR